MASNLNVYSSGVILMDIQMWESLCLSRGHPLVFPHARGGQQTSPMVCVCSGPLAECRTEISHTEWTRRFLLSPRNLLNQVAFRGGLKLQPCVASQASAWTWCACPVRHPRRDFRVLHSTSSVKSILAPDSLAFLVIGTAISVYVLCGGR